MPTDDTFAPEILELTPATTAVVAGVVADDELTDFYDRSFGLVAGVAAAQGVDLAGPAFGLYHGMPAETVDLEVGFPTAGAVTADGEVRPGSLPGGPTARAVHHGGFDGLGDSWERLRAWIADNGHTPGPSFWEVYVTEPSPDMDPADLRTELYWPVT